MLGDTIFEVVENLRDARLLRSKLTNAARIIAENPRRRAVLILDQPKMSEKLIQDEWQSLEPILRHNIFERLRIIVRNENEILTISGRSINHHLIYDGEFSARIIETIVQHSTSSRNLRQARPYDTYFDILRVLLIRFFRERRPITTKRLSEIVGCSYPTTAAALKRLSPHIRRDSDRRVSMRSFPRDAWLELAAVSERVRLTRFFADRSSKPRLLQRLVDRLCDLGRNDVAVGGVLAAKHYFPKLDLLGSPRLDLTVHVSNETTNTYDFIKALDAGLVIAERGEAPRVAIHTIIRKESMFEHGDSGHMWADQVECLLDLHEARLEAQAEEFLENLIATHE